VFNLPLTCISCHNELALILCFLDIYIYIGATTDIDMNIIQSFDSHLQCNNIENIHNQTEIITNKLCVYILGLSIYCCLCFSIVGYHTIKSSATFPIALLPEYNLLVQTFQIALLAEYYLLDIYNS